MSAIQVWHEEVTGIVEGPALFDGQQQWVKLEDHQSQIAILRAAADALFDALEQISINDGGDQYGVIDEWSEAAAFSESKSVAERAIAAYKAA